MPQLRTRCDAHHKKALCVGQERRVVRSADGPSGTQLYIALFAPLAGRAIGPGFLITEPFGRRSRASAARVAVSFSRAVSGTFCRAKRFGAAR